PVGGSSLGEDRKTNCTAIPGSADASHAWVVAQKTVGAIPASGADQGAMPATGTSGKLANARSSGNSEATQACPAVDSAALSIRPRASGTGSTPVLPNKKEASSDCSCVIGTTAPATEASRC